ERVRGDVDRTGDGLPRGVEEDASEGVLRGECDRVDDAVDVALETFGQGREIVFVRGVEFDDLRGDRQALGDHLSDLHLTAEAREDDLGSLLLCEAGGGEGDRGLGEHAGDENALSVEDSHGGPFFKGVDLSAPLTAASLV